MSSDRAPEPAVHDGIALGQFPAGHAEFNEFLVSAGRHGDGLLFPLDGISVCHVWNRSSCEAFICCFDCLFTGDTGSARVRPIIMEEEFRRKNRRLLMALIVFAVGFTVLIILWKLSIYQKP